MTRLGNRARRTIIRAGAVMEALSSHPSDGLLLTGTLPGSTLESFASMGAYSGYLVHRLKAWIAKYHQDVNSLYVWEYQSRGALHLHYALLVPETGKRHRIMDGFRDQWVRMLSSVCDMSGIDIFDSGKGYSYRDSPDKVQTDAQEIRQSVGRYLAKYLTEIGKQKITCPQSWLFPPSRWWGVSRPLLHELQKRTKTELMYYSGYGEAVSVYEDMTGLLNTASEVCHTYEHRDTRTHCNGILSVNAILCRN